MVKSSKDFLSPGDSDDIEFDFGPHGHPGKRQKYVIILINDAPAKKVLAGKTGSVLI